MFDKLKEAFCNHRKVYVAEIWESNELRFYRVLRCKNCGKFFMEKVGSV